MLNSTIDMAKACSDPSAHVKAPAVMEQYVNAKAVKTIKKTLSNWSAQTVSQTLMGKSYTPMDILRMVDSLRVDRSMSGKLTIKECCNRLATIKAASHVLTEFGPYKW
jgi:hypothetical protein